MSSKELTNIEVEVKVIHVNLSDEGIDKTVCVMLLVFPSKHVEISDCWIEDEDGTTFSFRDHNYL